MRLDAEQAERRAEPQMRCERVAIGGTRGDAQPAFVGRADEAGPAGEHRSPGAALRVETADHERRQLAEQLLVLQRHRVANHALPHRIDLVAHTDALLHRGLAVVEGLHHAAAG